MEVEPIDVNSQSGVEDSFSYDIKGAGYENSESYSEYSDDQRSEAKSEDQIIKKSNDIL